MSDNNKWDLERARIEARKHLQTMATRRIRDRIIYPSYDEAVATKVFDAFYVTPEWGHASDNTESWDSVVENKHLNAPGLSILWGNPRVGKSTAASSLCSSLKEILPDVPIGVTSIEPDGDLATIDSIAGFVTDVVCEVLPDLNIDPDKLEIADGLKDDDLREAKEARSKHVFDRLMDSLEALEKSCGIVFVDSLSTLVSSKEVQQTSAFPKGEPAAFIPVLQTLNNVFRSFGIYVLGIYNPQDYTGPTPNFAGSTRSSIFLVSRREGEKPEGLIGHIRLPWNDENGFPRTVSYTDKMYVPTGVISIANGQGSERGSAASSTDPFVRLPGLY